MRHDRGEEPAAVRIEAENELAWCGDRRLDLTPKAFAVLRHLVERADRLVTKDELLTVVWADTVVSEAALASCIRDLRRALDDSSRTPRYIETVHRRGFRFIGPVGGLRSSVQARRHVAAHQPIAHLVGREAELARLHGHFTTALDGRRQVVFVTGEPGIGKTALVESFLAQLEPSDGLRIGRGQCVEQYGAGEAYLPVLEALGRMGRDDGGDALVRVLRQYAPTWLAQLPALLTDEELEAVQRRAQGSTRERMLRELIEAVDAISVEGPLVLLLEDLHWSDSATIDLIALLARRRDAARLLVVGTYRPADVAAKGHPLGPVKHELQLHRQCEEIGLEFLDEAAVDAYLVHRLPDAALPPRFVQVLHRNTGGNPLFLVNLIDHLVAQERLHQVDGRWKLSVPVEEIAAEVPQTLRELVEKQIERLAPSEQAVLAVASVAGAEFSAALASIDGIDADEADRCCAVLARREQFIRAAGVTEWPDGTVAGRYGFVHALYQHAFYERIEIGRRVGLHVRIGDRLERAHGARAGDIAGELATHFEAGRDLERAVRYRRRAAHNALAHQGHHEAVRHAARALELLATFPESPESLQEELAIRTVLGSALLVRGSMAPEVVHNYTRSRELCSRVGATADLFPALVGLFRYYISRADLPVSHDLAKQLLTLADATDDTTIRFGAHNTAGIASFYAGDFGAALSHLERGVDVEDTHGRRTARWPAFWGGHDARVSGNVHAAWALWALGYPDRAAAKMREAVDRARAAGFPFALANASIFAASFHALRRDVDAVREATDEAVRHSTEHRFELLLPLTAVHEGWLLCESGKPEDGAARVRAGVMAYRNIGVGIGLPTFLGVLVEAEGKCGRYDEALAVAADGLAMSRATGASYWDAELRRLQGTAYLAVAGSRRGGRAARASAEREAEACFTDALQIARTQQAKSLELRAAMSLSRLWQRTGKADDARGLLTEVYGWFCEGFDTADLVEAMALRAIL